MILTRETEVPTEKTCSSVTSSTNMDWLGSVPCMHPRHQITREQMKVLATDLTINLNLLLNCE